MYNESRPRLYAPRCDEEEPGDPYVAFLPRNPDEVELGRSR